MEREVTVYGQTEAATTGDSETVRSADVQGTQI